MLYTASMEFGKTSHIAYKFRYHISVAVKFRKVLLRNEFENCIKEILEGISDRYEIVIDKVGYDQYQLNIFFCATTPWLSPLRVISVIKSITAKKRFE